MEEKVPREEKHQILQGTGKSGGGSGLEVAGSGGEERGSWWWKKSSNEPFTPTPPVKICDSPDWIFRSKYGLDIPVDGNSGVYWNFRPTDSLFFV